MEEIDGVYIWGDPIDQGALSQIRTCATDGDAVHCALMADHHKGYAVPIGGVVAYEGKISPSGGGYDIACGNKAVLLDVPADEVRTKIKTIMDDIWTNLEFGVGRRNQKTVEHDLFDDDAWQIGAVKGLKEMARLQLGTIGSGNHYVDLFADEKDRTWVGVHFGSRGLGHKTATHFLKAGGAKDGMDVAPLVLDTASDLGSEYLECMNLAGRYAYAGRDWVCGEVARILGANILEEVHNHHNFCIAGDQKIPMPHGFKRMRDIVKGDEIYAFDPTKGLAPTRVLAHWKSGKKLIYTIQTRNRAIRVSGTHPVQVVRVETAPHPTRPWMAKRQGHLSWIRAEDIRVGDIVVCASGYYAGDQAIGEEMARFVGAFLGDGWIRHSNPQVSGYSVGLAVGSANEKHTARYERVCASVFAEARWNNNAPGAYGLSCSSKKVHDQISSMKIGLKSSQKNVPYFAYSLPRNEKMTLLAGYIDADGSVASNTTSNYGRGAIASVSRELVEGLRELAISCGLQVTTVRSENRKTNFGPCVVHRCTLSADSVALLELWHESKSSNQRKTLHRRRQGLEPSKIGYLELPDDVFAQTVVSADLSSEPEDVYDLAVEHESHSFVCEGIVVHNCWRETHDGRDLWVVRKGATPAFPGQKGFVGGSMGDQSVILEGVASDEGSASLYSTVHGAGRVMSRTAARGKRNWKTGEIIAPGAVSNEMMRDWVRKAGVELRGAGTDESPHCYKRLPSVLAHHSKSVRVLHTLTPLGVAMAGENEVDPYKD